MQRGRFLILIGILLAVMALALLLLMNRDQEEAGTPEPNETRTMELLPTPAPATPVPVDRVVVAQQNIKRGTRLITDTVGLSEMVSLVEWPSSWVTQEALTSMDQVEGKIARSDIPRGALVTAAMLTDIPGDLAATGSDAALMIPPDKVGIAIPVDHISSVGWSLRRGDRVDVLISFLMVDLDEEFQTALPNQASSLVTVEAGGVVQEGTTILQGTYGRIEQDPFGQPINVIPSEAKQRPRLISQITVRDAEVLNVGPWGELFGVSGSARVSMTPTTTGEGAPGDEGASDESSGDGSTDFGPQQVEILLEADQQLTEDEVLREYLNASAMQPLLLTVSPQDALVLKWADEAGAAMHVVLRSHADAGVRLPDTEAVTMQYMVDRFNIALPPVLAYGPEPATSELIRGLLQLPEKLWTPWSAQTAPTQQQGPPR